MDMQELLTKLDGIQESIKHLPGMHDQASHDPYKGKKAIASAETLKRGGRTYEVLMKAHYQAMGDKFDAYRKDHPEIDWSTVENAGVEDVLIGESTSMIIDSWHPVDWAGTPLPDRQESAYHEGQELSTKDLEGLPSQKMSYVYANFNKSGKLMVNDGVAEFLFKKNGYDGLPDVVSEEEMNAYVANGDAEMFRGVMTSEASNSFKMGEGAWAGAGMLGNGVYTAYGMEGFKAASAYGPNVMRIALRKNAKVAFRGQLEKEMVRVHEKAKADGDAKMLEVTSDVGRYGAYKGLDAILSPAYHFVCVLNRTALRVQVKDVPPHLKKGQTEWQPPAKKKYRG